jgi:hypothetical protein
VEFTWKINFPGGGAETAKLVFSGTPPPSPTLKVLRSAGFAKMVCKRFMAKILDTKVLITKGLGGRDLKSRDRHCLD